MQACHSIMGIPEHDICDMTGSTNPDKRRPIWQQKRVFFCTPSTLQNDLSRGSCPAKVCGNFDII